MMNAWCWKKSMCRHLFSTVSWIAQFSKPQSGQAKREPGLKSTCISSSRCSGRKSVRTTHNGRARPRAAVKSGLVSMPTPWASRLTSNFPLIPERSLIKQTDEAGKRQYAWYNSIYG